MKILTKMKKQIILFIFSNMTDSESDIELPELNERDCSFSVHLNFSESNDEIYFLAIGDAHFRIKDANEVDTYLTNMNDFISDKHFDFVVLLGDVLHYHERIENVSILNKAYELISNLRKRTDHLFVLVGNHDMINNEQFLTDNHWMNGLKEWHDITIVDKGAKYFVKGRNFTFSPYVPKSKFINALNIINENWKQSDVIFAHQDFYGANYGFCIDNTGDKWDETFPFIMSGHIHEKQKIGRNIYYTGASRFIDAGEKIDKTIATGLIVNNRLYITEHSLNLPKNITMSVSVSEFENLQFDTTKSKIRVIVSGTKEELKTLSSQEKFKQLEEQGIKFKLRTKKKAIVNVSLRGNFRDILKGFIENENNDKLKELYKKYIV